MLTTDEEKLLEEQTKQFMFTDEPAAIILRYLLYRVNRLREDNQKLWAEVNKLKTQLEIK